MAGVPHDSHDSTSYLESRDIVIPDVRGVLGIWMQQRLRTICVK